MALIQTYRTNKGLRRDSCGCLNLLGSTTLLLALACLRRKECWVDVWDDATLADNDITEQLVQPAIGESKDYRTQRRMTHSSSLRMASCR